MQSQRRKAEAGASRAKAVARQRLALARSIGFDPSSNGPGNNNASGDANRGGAAPEGDAPPGSAEHYVASALRAGKLSRLLAAEVRRCDAALARVAADDAALDGVAALLGSTAAPEAALAALRHEAGAALFAAEAAKLRSGEAAEAARRAAAHGGSAAEVEQAVQVALLALEVRRCAVRGLGAVRLR